MSNPNNGSKNLKVAVPKSTHMDLSHQHLTTLDFFRLQPILCTEMIKGDKFSINVRSLIEAAPLATKIYGSCHLDLHAFFVPFRILWPEWNNYYYGDGSSTAPVLPQVDMSSSAVMNRFSDVSNPYVHHINNVFSSLGYPVMSSWFKRGLVKRLSQLPGRAYHQIWWDWFRDSQNIPEANKSSYLRVSSGLLPDPSVSSFFLAHYRTFRKDFITTLLSSSQAVVGSGSAQADSVFSATLGGSSSQVQQLYAAGVSDSSISLRMGSEVSSAPLGKRLVSSLQIPVLRGAAAMQRFLERLGISGTRPLERIMATFGSRVSPERLDMSEFIGYKSIPVGIDGLINTGSSTVLSDNSHSPFGSDDTSDFNTYCGRSSASGQTETFRYNSPEHGYFMVIASIVPDYINANVLDRIFTRGLSANTQGNIDFYQPDFDGVGYQDVLLQDIAQPLELNSDGTGQQPWDSVASNAPNRVVGYQPYAEDYRYLFDKISGDFLSPTSGKYLQNMAFTRDLTTSFTPDQVVAGLPLSTATDNTCSQFDNKFQVTNSGLDHFILNNYFVIDAVRPMSGSQLPTELSDMANSMMADISKGGVRL